MTFVFVRQARIIAFAVLILSKYERFMEIIDTRGCVVFDMPAFKA